MTRWEKALFGVVFAFVGAGVYLARAQQDFFAERFTVEDGPIEWLTVIALLCGAGLCLKRFARAPRWRAGAGTLLLGLLFFLGAGEEISWGQRLFDLESPDFFQEHQEHTVQGETNLHNLVIGGVKINKVLFSFVLGICIVAYFFVLPVLYRRVRRIRDWADRWALPVPRRIHVASFALVLVLVAAMPSPRRWEVLEFGGCAVFTLLVWRPLNATRLP